MAGLCLASPSILAKRLRVEDFACGGPSEEQQGPGSSGAGAGPVHATKRFRRLLSPRCAPSYPGGLSGVVSAALAALLAMFPGVDEVVSSLAAPRPDGQRLPTHLVSPPTNLLPFFSALCADGDFCSRGLRQQHRRSYRAARAVTPVRGGGSRGLCSSRCICSSIRASRARA
jgi:hypothetical protein